MQKTRGSNNNNNNMQSYTISFHTAEVSGVKENNLEIITATSLDGVTPYI
jgi:hypothetical protein